MTGRGGSWRKRRLSCHLPRPGDGSIRALGSRAGWACHRREGRGRPHLPANPPVITLSLGRNQNLLVLRSYHSSQFDQQRKKFHCCFNVYLFDHSKNWPFSCLLCVFLLWWPLFKLFFLISGIYLFSFEFLGDLTCKYIFYVVKHLQNQTKLGVARKEPLPFLCNSELQRKPLIINICWVNAVHFLYL